MATSWVVLSACGDDSAGGGGGGGSTSGGPLPDRTEQVCERWVDAFCTAIARCFGETLSYKECVQSYDCATAKSADEKLVEKCEQQLPQSDCASLQATVAGFCENAIEFPSSATTGTGEGGAGGQGGAGGPSTGTGGGEVGDPLVPPVDTCVEWCAQAAMAGVDLDCGCDVDVEDCARACQQNNCGSSSECPESVLAATCGALGVAEDRFTFGCGDLLEGQCVMVTGTIGPECNLVDVFYVSGELR